MNTDRSILFLIGLSTAFIVIILAIGLMVKWIDNNPAERVCLDVIRQNSPINADVKDLCSIVLKRKEAKQ